MKTRILLPLLTLVFWACSDNESNPSKTEVPEPPSSSSVVIEVPDSCGGFVDARDGQFYCTVKIGEQTWMAKNLAYALPGSICRNDDPANCEKYGRLYSWTQTVLKSDAECGRGVNCVLTNGPLQGICPEGWSLPDTSDWKQLIRFVRENTDSKTLAASLMSTEEPEWKETVAATDLFGFSVLASAGYYNPDISFSGDDQTFFWSRTPNTLGEDVDDAFMFEIIPLENVIWVGVAYKDAFYSVRCIKY